MEVSQKYDSSEPVWMYVQFYHNFSDVQIHGLLRCLTHGRLSLIPQTCFQLCLDNDPSSLVALGQIDHSSW